MKSILLTMFLIFTSLLKADYVPPKIHMLVLKADKIVQGEISCVDNDVFQITVIKSILEDEHVITVQKFKEWNCGKRYIDYEVGQQSLFFLRYDGDKLRTMSGGNEGEMPIIMGAAYVHASSFNSID
ncbi:hypothetical protein [Maribacter sp. HTCC2170]|uniref:hypothetical protein n=1 Tax=Maribacter sp. (strain HTCC2170 / KCCM 42371) TaxID=313603 RepID=UPI00006B21C2|nr:hypothetical protein [Maribacter sp. HTCC2170]EAR00347.1 hypothetical protein FB2170_13036 [Maribacter sp. HTCC2170]